MKVNVYTISGYEEVGKNMTAIEVDDDIFIFDMGVSVDRLVELESQHKNVGEIDTKTLMRLNVIPDDSILKNKRNKVKGIVITHAHLDHLWAAMRLASHYNAPILMTPYTAEVFRKLLEDYDIDIPNKIIRLNLGSEYNFGNNSIEFVYATHSVPQTAIAVLHTKKGAIVYANDWKFDEYPVIGKRTDYKRLREIANEGVLVYLSDSVRIQEEKRTYSESVVIDMLRDILFWTENQNNIIFFTTFSSHISRIKTIVEFAKKLGREPIFMGRSLLNYVDAAEFINLVDFSQVKRFRNSKEIKKGLHKVEKDRGNYLVILTGNQGEPNSALRRIADGRIPFEFLRDDQVIFSCQVIPTPINQANRAFLEKILHNQGVRIFKDVHVSGHASREDHRDMLKILNPEIYIPSHGDTDKLASASMLARELGYKLGKDVFITQNNNILSFNF